MSFTLSRTTSTSIETTSFTVLPATNEMLVVASSMNGLLISVKEIMSKPQAKALWKKLTANGFTQ
jgi:Na+/phosphate symporter